MATPSATLANLESAFAGESMAHIKYRYFARLCRAAGDEATAKLFEDTAAQEVLHAWGHLDLLYPAASMTPARCLQMAIEGARNPFQRNPGQGRKTFQCIDAGRGTPCRPLPRTARQDRRLNID